MSVILSSRPVGQAIAVRVASLDEVGPIGVHLGSDGIVLLSLRLVSGVQIVKHIVDYCPERYLVRCHWLMFL